MPSSFPVSPTFPSLVPIFSISPSPTPFFAFNISRIASPSTLNAHGQLAEGRHRGHGRRSRRDRHGQNDGRLSRRPPIVAFQLPGLLVFVLCFTSFLPGEGGDGGRRRGGGVNTIVAPATGSPAALVTCPLNWRSTAKLRSGGLDMLWSPSSPTKARPSTTVTCAGTMTQQKPSAGRRSSHTMIPATCVQRASRTGLGDTTPPLPPPARCPKIQSPLRIKALRNRASRCRKRTKTSLRRDNTAYFTRARRWEVSTDHQC